MASASWKLCSISGLHTPSASLDRSSFDTPFSPTSPTSVVSETCDALFSLFSPGGGFQLFDMMPSRYLKIGNNSFLRFIHISAITGSSLVSGVMQSDFKSAVRCAHHSPKMGPTLQNVGLMTFCQLLFIYH